jgi:hypothetical protein
MFEDFSFSSPSSSRPARLTLDTDDRLMADCDSTLVSPLSSRCPSPKSAHRISRTLSRSRSLFLRSPQPPTSVPFPYDHKRLSIGTLTKKLHEHTLQTSTGDESQDDVSASPTTPYSIVDIPLRYATFPVCYLTPPDTDHDDEGWGDSSCMTSPSTSSNPQSPFLRPTSVPCEDPGSWNDPLSVRMQRQRISRLQCHAPAGVDSIRRVLSSDEEGLEMDPFDEEDCHPSSLPPQLSPRRRALTLNRSRFRPASVSFSEHSLVEARARRKSVSSVFPSHRIDKNYHQSLSGRELRKKSEQELRRKSLVHAALASMAEKPGK